MEVPGAGYVVPALLAALFGRPASTYARRLVTVADRGTWSPAPGSPAVVAGCGTAAAGFAVVLYFEIRRGS